MTLFHAIRRRYLINRAVRELSGLNNTILQDIGIERANINEVVENMIDSRIAAGQGSTPARTGYVTVNYNAAGGAAA